MSQPVRNVMAPRLVAPRRNSRRAGLGRSLAASLIKSLGSTPGMVLRTFGIALSSNLALVSPRSSSAKYHGAQASRHQDCEHDVNHQECHDGRHGEEVDVARRIVAAEHGGDFLKLHRLP